MLFKKQALEISICMLLYSHSYVNFLWTFVYLITLKTWNIPLFALFSWFCFSLWVSPNSSCIWCGFPKLIQYNAQQSKSGFGSSKMFVKDQSIMTHTNNILIITSVYKDVLWLLDKLCFPIYMFSFSLLDSI